MLKEMTTQRSSSDRKLLLADMDNDDEEEEIFSQLNSNKHAASAATANANAAGSNMSRGKNKESIEFSDLKFNANGSVNNSAGGGGGGGVDLAKISNGSFDLELNDEQNRILRVRTGGGTINSDDDDDDDDDDDEDDDNEGGSYFLNSQTNRDKFEQLINSSDTCCSRSFQFLILNLTFFINGAAFCLFIDSREYFIDLMKLSYVSITNAFISSLLAVLVGVYLAAYLVSKFERFYLLFVCSFISSLCLLIIPLIKSFFLLIIFMFIFGICFGLTKIISYKWSLKGGKKCHNSKTNILYIQIYLGMFVCFLLIFSSSFRGGTSGGDGGGTSNDDISGKKSLLVHDFDELAKSNKTFTNSPNMKRKRLIELLELNDLKRMIEPGSSTAAAASTTTAAAVPAILTTTIQPLESILLPSNLITTTTAAASPATVAATSPILTVSNENLTTTIATSKVHLKKPEAADGSYLVQNHVTKPKLDQARTTINSELNLLSYDLRDYFKLIDSPSSSSPLSSNYLFSQCLLKLNRTCSFKLKNCSRKVTSFDFVGNKLKNETTDTILINVSTPCQYKFNYSINGTTLNTIQQQDTTTTTAATPIPTPTPSPTTTAATILKARNVNTNNDVCSQLANDEPKLLNNEKTLNKFTRDELTNRFKQQRFNTTCFEFGSNLAKLIDPNKYLNYSCYLNTNSTYNYSETLGLELTEFVCDTEAKCDYTGLPSQNNPQATVDVENCIREEILRITTTTTTTTTTSSTTTTTSTIAVSLNNETTRANSIENPNANNNFEATTAIPNKSLLTTTLPQSVESTTVSTSTLTAPSTTTTRDLTTITNQMLITIVQTTTTNGKSDILLTTGNVNDHNLNDVSMTTNYYTVQPINSSKSDDYLFDLFNASSKKLKDFYSSINRIQLFYILIGLGYFLVSILHSFLLLPILKTCFIGACKYLFYLIKYLALRCVGVKKMKQRLSHRSSPKHVRIGAGGNGSIGNGGTNGNRRALSLASPLSSLVTNSALEPLSTLKQVYGQGFKLVLFIFFLYGGLLFNFFLYMDNYLISRVSNEYFYQAELINKLFYFIIIIGRVIVLFYLSRKSGTSSNDATSSGTSSATTMASGNRSFLKRIFTNLDAFISRRPILIFMKQNFLLLLTLVQLVIVSFVQLNSSHFNDNLKLILYNNKITNMETTPGVPLDVTSLPTDNVNKRNIIQRLFLDESLRPNGVKLNFAAVFTYSIVYPFLLSNLIPLLFYLIEMSSNKSSVHSPELLPQDDQHHTEPIHISGYLSTNNNHYLNHSLLVYVWSSAIFGSFLISLVNNYLIYLLETSNSFIYSNLILSSLMLFMLIFYFYINKSIYSSSFSASIRLPKFVSFNNFRANNNNNNLNKMTMSPSSSSSGSSSNTANRIQFNDYSLGIDENRRTSNNKKTSTNRNSMATNGGAGGASLYNLNDEDEDEHFYDSNMKKIAIQKK